MGTSGVAGSVSTRAPLVRTAKEFQTKQNSCPVHQPVSDFQLYWLIMNLLFKILIKSPTTNKIFE